MGSTLIELNHAICLEQISQPYLIKAAGPFLPVPVPSPTASFPFIKHTQPYFIQVVEDKTGLHYGGLRSYSPRGN
jgi:hypothetical protein